MDHANPPNVENNKEKKVLFFFYNKCIISRKWNTSKARKGCIKERKREFFKRQGDCTVLLDWLLGGIGWTRAKNDERSLPWADSRIAVQSRAALEVDPSEAEGVMSWGLHARGAARSGAPTGVQPSMGGVRMRGFLRQRSLGGPRGIDLLRSPHAPTACPLTFPDSPFPSSPPRKSPATLVDTMGRQPHTLKQPTTCPSKLLIFHF